MRRIIPCIVLSLMLCVTMIPVKSEVSHAASSAVANYSSAKTIAYAKKNWNNGVGDCIAFARLCAEAGGMPRDKAKKSYSCKSYVDYLVKNDYAEFNKLTYSKLSSTATTRYIDQSINAGKVAPGDVIIYKCTASGCNRPYFHAVIATYPDTTGKYAGLYRFYGHNSAANNSLLKRIQHNSDKYDCHHATKYVELWALHIKSKENGFGSSSSTQTTTTTTSTTSSTSTSTTETSSTSFKSFKVVATKKMNTRSGPAKTYKKKSTVASGVRCTIVNMKNGWGQLRSGNWLSLRSMKVTEGFTIKITSKKLNMRTGPSTSYKSKGYIKTGTYDVVKIYGSWCKIEKNGYWVYMPLTKRI